MKDTFYYLQKGITLSQHRAIRGYIVWPIIINSVLLISISRYAYNEAGTLVDAWVSLLPTWLDFLGSVGRLLIILLLLLIAMFSFAVTTTLITAPFYCLVAEKAAKLLNHSVAATDLSPAGIAGLCVRSITREIHKLAYYLPRSLLLFLLSLIPAINVLSAPLWLLWGAWLMVLQFTDYAADNDHISATHCRTLLSKQKIHSLLLGGVIMLGMLTPVINIIAGVVAVCAATAYWVDISSDAVTNT